MSQILIVESDLPLARNLAGALTRQGHDVTYKADAQAAITSADAHRPDIIILDLLLAGRSGIEFLYELRSYPEWQGIPVIIYSSVPLGTLPAQGSLNQLNITKLFYKPTATIQDLVGEVVRLTNPAVA